MKRDICPYDDKRYLLSDLADGSPNPNTHAYGHTNLEAEEQFEADMPDLPGSDLIIERRERRVVKKHERVEKKLRALPGGDEGRESAAAKTDPQMAEEEEPEPEPPEKMPFENALAAGDSNDTEQGTSSRLGSPCLYDDPVQRLITAGRARPPHLTADG